MHIDTRRVTRIQEFWAGKQLPVRPRFNVKGRDWELLKRHLDGAAYADLAEERGLSRSTVTGRIAWAHANAEQVWETTDACPHCDGTGRLSKASQ